MNLAALYKDFIFHYDTKKKKILFNLNMLGLGLGLGLGRIFHNGTHIIPKMNSNIRSDHISCEISEMVMMVSD